MTLFGLFCTSIRTESERKSGHNFLNTKWIVIQEKADTSLSCKTRLSKIIFAVLNRFPHCPDQKYKVLKCLPEITFKTTVLNKYTFILPFEA